MSRIESGKINYGNSFVLNADGKRSVNKEITDAQLIADSIIAEAQKKAEAIMAEAQSKAAALVNAAKEEAETEKDEISSEAREQGFETGYEEGKEKITTEMEELVQSVENFAKCKIDMKHKIIKSIHTDILDLVLDVSEKVCKTELKQNRQIFLKIVENAILQLKEKENITIIVNPEMMRKIYEISEELKTKIYSLKTIKIVEDNSVSADGTIVESIGSRVDARVSTQIEQIAQKLFAELNATPEIELARELEDFETDLNDKPDQI